VSGFHDGVAARTIYGEARGESDLGKLAVACVLRNRIKLGRWGHTPAAVCMANMQFSCWNQNDPNRKLMLELDDNDLDLARCLFAWRSSEAGEDPTNGASHYKVRGTHARWAEGVMPCATVGHHEFFRDIA